MVRFADGKGSKEERYRCATMLHPLRRRIARLLCGEEELGAAEIAGRLKEPHDRIAYHLRVLFRRRVLEAVPRCRPHPALYRFSPQAEWAREMLVEEDE
jgi:DNA-binding transcriptional ArsR family regulator